MHLLPTHPSNDETFAFCLQWLGYLASGDYHAAHAMIVPDGHYRWSPELIERVISNYGFIEPHRSGHRFQVTPPESARGVPSRQCLRVDPDDDTCTGEVHSQFPFAVYWFLDGPSRKGALGWVHMDYPLDGEWSDLSSIFDIVPRGDSLALDLERIEVL